MVETIDSSGRRSVWIYLIFIYYFIASGWKLITYFLVFSGAFPITQDQAAFIDTLSFFDIASSVLIAIANLYAAIALLFLRREASYLFAYVFVISVMITFWHGATRDLYHSLGASGIIGLILGYAISAQICLYAWTLKRRGLLR